jgi:hypothetical protein
MIAFGRSPHLGRRVALLATFALTLMAVWAVSVRAGARDAVSPQTTATPPYALFQDSTLTASGNTITANNLPVVTTTGKIYDDVTIQFDVADDGTLTVSSGYPQIVAAAKPLISHFLAGSYAGPSTDAEFLITVNGPGVTTGGATEWSLSAATSASSTTYPTSAMWYVGPLASNPLYSRIKAAGITSTAYSYGVGSGYNSGSNWGTDSLLGFSQTNGALTIVSFTHNTVDNSTPVDQITYTKK